MKHAHILIWAVVFVALAGLAAVAQPVPIGAVRAGDIQAVSPMFPPSVGEEPVVYAWALFGLLVVSLMSASVMSTLGKRMARERKSASDPVFLVQVMLFCLFLTIFIGFTPDTLVLLLWGEVSAVSMSRLSLADKLLDGACVLPFVLAFTFPVVVRKLRQTTGRFGVVGAFVSVVDAQPVWRSARHLLLLIGLCGLTGFGVAFVKWWSWQS
jgi:ABC-type Na+ efflux pump permease subunit